MSKPTLVIVHGSWHCPEHYRSLIDELEKHGYKCIAVRLPSTQSPDLPPANLLDDIIVVRTTVKDELEKGSNVVVVSHSFGGCVANASLSGLDSETRSIHGASTSVVGQAFMCAIPIPKGTSFIAAIGGKPGPMHDLRTKYFSWVGEPGPEYYFYNDLSPEEGKKWGDLLKPQSWTTVGGVAPYAAYMDIPCGYLYCKQDRAFPFEGQQGMIGAAKEAGAKFVHEETLDASHSPFLSMPEATAKFVRRVAGETVA